MITQKMTEIAVIGAGISGLSSAVKILENAPGVKVTIFSEQFSPNTTSDVAGGFCVPYLLEETPKDVQMQWFELTMDHLYNLYHCDNSHEYGISFVSGYTLFSQPEQIPFWKDSVLDFREINDEEKKILFPNLKIVNGWFFSTLFCECPLYLPYLIKRFTDGGGVIKQKKINHLSELADEFDIIINCCGVQAGEIAEDVSLYPIRGQIIKVEAPWIKHFYNLDDDCYILPLQNSIILGGTNQIDDYDLIPRQEDHDGIFERICKVNPQMKACKIIEDKVGLRPGRKSVRVEEGISIQGARKTAKVVHNYGHGGSGITLHWGCAEQVTQIVSGILEKLKL